MPLDIIAFVIIFKCKEINFYVQNYREILNSELFVHSQAVAFIIFTDNKMYYMCTSLHMYRVRQISFFFVKYFKTNY